MLNHSIKSAAVVLLLSLCSQHVSAQQSLSDKIITIAVKYLGTPYVGHTLEVNDKEELIINCDEVDCTTFLEYVTAEAISPANHTTGEIIEGDFADKVRTLRYKDGKITDYASRNHYFTEWINNNIKNGIIEDVTAHFMKSNGIVNVNYMTTHPDLYKHLKNDKAMQQKIRRNEEAINGQEFAYIPKKILPSEGYNWIKNGDLIAIVTNRPGLDIAHVGFAFYANDLLMLIHASSTSKKVEVSEKPLTQMLKENNNWVGIRVLRIKD